MTNIIEYKIDQEFDNIRLDRWIRDNIQQFSQSFIEKLLRSKKITVNDNKIKSNIRLKNFDIIKIRKDLLSENQADFHKKIDQKYIDMVRDNIIFEDENIMVINKISKLAVQGGSKIRFSIDDILPFLSQGNAKMKLVHRLDKDTSGILIIAKNNVTTRILSEAFHDKQIKKKYYAILTNRPKKTEGVIDNYIKKTNINGKERMMLSDKIQGVRAISFYKILKTLKDNYCLVEFRPLTGRTHQLRFHAEILNCPILGDKKYGTNKIESNEPVDNLFLHAQSIDLGNILGKSIKIDTDLPLYFKEFISKFVN